MSLKQREVLLAEGPCGVEARAENLFSDASAARVTFVEHSDSHHITFESSI